MTRSGSVDGGFELSHNAGQRSLFSVKGSRDLRYIALILSFALLMQFNLLVAPTYADTITVTTTTTSTPGGINGQLPVSKVGALIAGDALAILSGTEIKIESKSKSKSNSSSSSTPPGNLLTGVLMQTKTAGGSASGYAVFNGGDRFSRINSSSCEDKVTTVTGATFSGSITSATAAALSMSTSSGAQTINASDIADIHLARAFKYNINDFASPGAKMNFTTTCIHSVASAKVKSDHGNTTKKLIIVGLALTVVAVAVAVPVAVACSSHHHNNNNNQIIANIIASRRVPVVPQPTLPAAMTMPTPQRLGQIYLANLQNRSSQSLSSTSSSSSSGGQFVTTQSGTFFSP
jgi:hypothetical protein